MIKLCHGELPHCRQTTPCLAGLMWSGTLWRLRLRCWRTGFGKRSLCKGCPSTIRPETRSLTSCLTNSSSPALPTPVGIAQGPLLHWRWFVWLILVIGNSAGLLFFCFFFWKSGTVGRSFNTLTQLHWTDRSQIKWALLLNWVLS